jgi:predicted phage terminase large subunit-like protein
LSAQPLLDNDDTLIELDNADKWLIADERERLQNSLHEFVKASWHLVEPAAPFVDNWHIRELCKVLEDVYYGRQDRVIINVPPGTMKSLLVSVFWPAWMWAKNAKRRVLTAAYGAHLTTRDNLRLRDVVISPWFQRLFPLRLVEDQNTKTRFNTDAGGWRIATSVGGVGTGEHPDIIIIDDALTATQAESEQERSAANNWFDRTISSRGVGRGVAIVVVGQRLHEDDLPGYLKKKGGWEVVCFPMRYEKCTCKGDPKALADDQRCSPHRADITWRPDPRDPRTEPGELLFPSMFDLKKVKRLENDLGPYGSAGQLQQRPSPEGGGLFKREWFQYVDASPVVARRARGWDTAATQGDGDYTRGVLIAEVGGIFYIEDGVGDQLSPAGVDALILATAKRDGKEIVQREEKEGGSAGKTVVEARAKLLVGYDYAGVPISGSKITRAKPFRAQCEAGNVRIVRGPWNEDYVRELCAFPTGKHDDWVDASSAAFNAVLLEPEPKQAGVLW